VQVSHDVPALPDVLALALVFLVAFPLLLTLLFQIDVPELVALSLLLKIYSRALLAVIHYLTSEFFHNIE
jgi:hypothetical protein